MTNEIKELRTDYSVPKVAAILGCTSGTVRNRIEDGTIKAYRIGGTGHYRIPWSEVERLRSDWTVKAL